MKKFLAKLNQDPRSIYLAGIAFGVVITGWYDHSTGGDRWVIIVTGVLIGLGGLMGITRDRKGK